MTVLDILILAAVAVWLGAVIFAGLRRRKKRGGCPGCSGCCADCSACGSCRGCSGRHG